MARWYGDCCRSGTIVCCNPFAKEGSMARSNTTSGSRASRGGGSRGMSATQLLRKDHQTVQQLLQRAEKTSSGAETKQRLFSEIERELETHSTIEEEIFYPAV